MTILSTFTPIEKIISNNIESDSTAHYVATESYDVGDIVQYSGKTWKSTKDGNVGNTPSDGSLSWFDQNKPMNEVAVFDNYPSTVSTNTSSDIVLTFDADDVDIIAISEMFGTELKIKLTDKETGNVTYENVINLQEYDEPNNIYEYFYTWGNIRQKTEHIEIVKKYYNQILEITITRKNGVASVGFLDFGQKDFLGCTLLDTTNLNFSAGGDFIYVDGKVQPLFLEGVIDLSIPVFIEDTSDRYNIIQTLLSYRGKRIVVIGDDTGDYLEYSMVGIFQEVPISMGSTTTYTLKIVKIEKG